MTARSIGLACCVAAFWVSTVEAQTEADDAVGWGESNEAAPEGEPSDPNDAVGWGEEAAEPAPQSEAPSRRVQAGMSGFLRSDWAMWTRPEQQPNRFAKSRQTLDLELRVRADHVRLVLGAHGMYDFAFLLDRDQYGAATIRTYEWLVRARDSYIAFSGDHVEFAGGFQRVAFGAGELFSVVDLVNPRDEREAGLIDLEDRRLPVLMSRLTTFWKEHRVELIWVHEAFFQLRPPPFGFYSPFRASIEESLIGPFINPEQVKAGVDYKDDPGRWDWASQQAFGRWTYSGTHLEAGLYAGSAIGYPGVAKGNPLELSPVGPLELPLLHKRYTMVGASVAKPIRDWLLHGEVSASIDEPVQLAQINEFVNPFGFTFERRNFVRWLVGLRYTGIESGAITLEYTQGTTGDLVQDDYSLPPLLPINPFFVGARWQQAFVRDRLFVEAVGVMVGPRETLGGFLRGQITYEVVDNFRMTLGYIFYIEGDVPSLLNGFAQNDRLFLRFRYDFATD